MPGDDFLLGAEFCDQRAQPHAQRLNPHQVDFLAEQPARVVFPKPGRLHHRLGFISIGIRHQHGFGLRKHSNALLQVNGKHCSHSESAGAVEGGSLFIWLLVATDCQRSAFYCSSTIWPLAYSKRFSFDKNDKPSRFSDSASSGSTRASTSRTTSPPISTIAIRVRAALMVPFAVVTLA